MTMLVAPEMMEGDSMEPVISDGQAICVVKDSYSAKRGQPDLNEVVVMEKVYSEDYADDNIIARVVGLPGDKIEIKDGNLYRNGKLHEVNGSSECPGEYSVTIDKDSVFILADNGQKNCGQQDNRSCSDERNQGKCQGYNMAAG